MKDAAHDTDVGGEASVPAHGTDVADVPCGAGDAPVKLIGAPEPSAVAMGTEHDTLIALESIFNDAVPAGESVMLPKVSV